MPAKRKNKYPPGAYRLVREAVKEAQSYDLAAVILKLSDLAKETATPNCGWLKKLKNNEIYTTGDVKEILQSLRKEQIGERQNAIN